MANNRPSSSAISATDEGLSLDPRGKSASRKQRQAGVELFRALAANGVIVIHVGLISPTRLSPGVDSLQHFLELTCVPFFLAASFYFTAITSRTEPFLSWLQQRSARLLIPYALWSLIYTALQVVQVLLRPDQADSLAKLFSDPIGRIFFGSSGVALYFLPLLFVGLVTMRLLTPLLAKRSLIVLGLGLAAALAYPVAMSVLESEFSLGFDTAFRVLPVSWLTADRVQIWSNLLPVRFALNILDLAFRCLPYIFLGWICAKFRILTESSPSRAVLGVASLSILVLANLNALTIPESLTGFSVLLLASVLPVSGRMSWAELLGRYSFGIYLVHQVILEGIKLGARNHPLRMDLSSVLPITLATFGTAALLVYLADQFGGRFGRLLMALPERVSK
jgi:surface polysaccharide O-acyltransferase-like enzyme